MTIMSCDITLWPEKQLFQSSQFLLLTQGNWVEDNLNCDDWVEGYGTGRLNTKSNIIMTARIGNNMKRCYFRSSSPGRKWEIMTELLWKKDFSLIRNWFGFTVIILPWKKKLQFNITSLQLLQHNFCGQIEYKEIQNMQQNLWDVTLNRPFLTSANWG